jgi:hypothetical protein
MAAVNILGLRLAFKASIVCSLCIEILARSFIRMSTLTDRKSSGIRDPYRSLLILLGGFLLALALFAGQTGYREDLPLSGQVTPYSPAATGLRAAS